LSFVGAVGRQEDPDSLVGEPVQLTPGALPHGRLHVLEGEKHAVAPDVLRPVVSDFLLGDRA
jgi:hypothetical protein